MANNDTLVRISRSTDTRLLARAARLFLVWGNRRLADAAHTRRGQVMQKMSAESYSPYSGESCNAYIDAKFGIFYGRTVY